MKTIPLLTLPIFLLSAVCLPAADAKVSSGTVTAGSATGGSVTGGSVTGGSVTGGSVTGGSVTGGSAQAGAVTGGHVGPGTVTAMAEGREIRVTAPGTVSVSVHGSTATIALGAQSLTVEKSKLLLDGKPLGEVPPKAQKIVVQVDDKDMLSVKGDGKEFARAKLQR